ncbi:hypothetical protein RB195_012085 [Necator americanus]|uniref:Uncharacterized protein n=1 Tax=Necator americanus TaxID=51031 RepID=A0ABR1D5G6_NECAM
MTRWSGQTRRLDASIVGSKRREAEASTATAIGCARSGAVRLAVVVVEMGPSRAAMLSGVSKGPSPILTTTLHRFVSSVTALRVVLIRLYCALH